MPGDLHTHTNFSDGSSDIELLPKLAARAGLTHLAVSDHDTTLSAEYAYGHPVVQGVRMIPAVELTGFDVARGRRVHLLCYWPKLTPALKEFCALMAARRNAATEKSMEELAARLRGRGTEDEAAVQKRLARAEEELREKDAYDFAIVNDDARRCADELYEILRARQSE